MDNLVLEMIQCHEEKTIKEGNMSTSHKNMLRHLLPRIQCALQNTIKQLTLNK